MKNKLFIYKYENMKYIFLNNKYRNKVDLNPIYIQYEELRSKTMKFL